MLGASFPRQAVEAVSDLDQGLLSDLLGSLVRKEEGPPGPGRQALT
ncbi:MAG: hypothetical protein ACYCST_11900 [Acidimicrobiales bacterium]